MQRFSQISLRLRRSPGCIAPCLLLVGGCFSVASLQAQDTAARTPTVSLTKVPSDQPDSSLLPEAPEATRHGAEPTTNEPIHTADVGRQPHADTYVFPSFRQRERQFLMDSAGPPAFIAPAFEAGIDTARPLKIGYPPDGTMEPGKHPAHGDVPEWGEGPQGYAKHYADRFGQGLVGTTSRYAFGELLREDVAYHRCECTKLLTRTAHALVGAYTAHTRSGRAVPSLPAFASPFLASEIAVAAWYPSRYKASDALRVSVLNYIAAPFRNLFEEFVTK